VWGVGRWLQQLLGVSYIAHSRKDATASTPCWKGRRSVEMGGVPGSITAVPETSSEP
jgi:hypothetical protein